MTASPKLAVCLVDDDPDIRSFFKALMKSSGLTALAFASAEEFLENFEQKPIGCILLDVRMPGMGGLELLATLRQRHVLTPIIMVTAHADVRLAVQAMRLGAMDVLEKPFREEDLLALVRQGFARFEKLRNVQSEIQSIAPRIASLTPRELEVLDLMVSRQEEPRDCRGPGHQHQDARHPPRQHHAQDANQDRRRSRPLALDGARRKLRAAAADIIMCA